MYGISFWDEDKYNTLYEFEEEKNKQIGTILREKKIEFFKEIDNYFMRCEFFNNDNEEIFFFRFTKFYRNQELFFFLIEIFSFDSLIKIIRN